MRMPQIFQSPYYQAEQDLIETSRLYRERGAYDYYALESHDWLADMATSHNVTIEESH